MRPCGEMLPARSTEEAAMYPAHTRSMTNGTALRMLVEQREREFVTMDIPAENAKNQETARCTNAQTRAAAARWNRAALYHVIRHSF